MSKNLKKEKSRYHKVPEEIVAKLQQFYATADEA